MAPADRVAFMETVLAPPEPTPAAVEAAKRYKLRFGGN